MMWSLIEQHNMWLDNWEPDKWKMMSNSFDDNFIIDGRPCKNSNRRLASASNYHIRTAIESMSLPLAMYELSNECTELDTITSVLSDYENSVLHPAVIVSQG